MAKTIDQDGNDLTWRAVYMRYYSQYEVACEDLDEAVSLLWWGQEDGQLSPLQIIEPTGHVLEGRDLDKALDDYEDAYNQRSIEKTSE